MIFVILNRTAMCEHGFSATSCIETFHMQLQEDILDYFMMINWNGGSIHQFIRNCIEIITKEKKKN